MKWEDKPLIGVETYKKYKNIIFFKCMLYNKHAIMCFLLYSFYYRCWWCCLLYIFSISSRFLCSLLLDRIRQEKKTFFSFFRFMKMNKFFHCAYFIHSNGWRKEIFLLFSSFYCMKKYTILSNRVNSEGLWWKKFSSRISCNKSFWIAWFCGGRVEVLSDIFLRVFNLEVKNVYHAKIYIWAVKVIKMLI